MSLEFTERVLLTSPTMKPIAAVAPAVPLTFAREMATRVMSASAGMVTMRSLGDVGDIDVRLTMRTDDGALIYMTYGGRIAFDDPAGMFAYVAPRFETGDERYLWLNRIQAVGMGQLLIDAAGARLEYEVHEVRRVAP